jgi:hypothetical protein
LKEFDSIHGSHKINLLPPAVNNPQDCKLGVPEKYYAAFGALKNILRRRKPPKDFSESLFDRNFLLLPKARKVFLHNLIFMRQPYSKNYLRFATNL